MDVDVNGSSTHTQSNFTEGYEMGMSNCDLPPHECDTLRIVKKTVLSLTLTADIVTFCISILFKRYKTFDQRIFVYIIIASLVESSAYLLTDGGYRSSACIIQSFLIQSMGISLFMWVGCLTLYLFLIITRRKTVTEMKNYEWAFLCICWILPIFLAFLPFTTDDYGLASMPYCWIKSAGTTGNVWRLSIYWVPVFAGIIAIMVCFVYLHKFVSYQNQIAPGHYVSNMQIELEQRLRPLKYYGVSFVFLHIFQVINRLQNIVAKPLFVLVLLHNVTHFLYGFVLCSLFFITGGTTSFKKRELVQNLNEYRRKLLCQYSEDIEELPIVPSAEASDAVRSISEADPSNTGKLHT